MSLLTPSFHRHRLSDRIALWLKFVHPKCYFPVNLELYRCLSQDTFMMQVSLHCSVGSILHVTVLYRHVSILLPGTVEWCWESLHGHTALSFVAEFSVVLSIRHNNMQVFSCCVAVSSVLVTSQPSILLLRLFCGRVQFHISQLSIWMGTGASKPQPNTAAITP